MKKSKRKLRIFALGLSLTSIALSLTSIHFSFQKNSIQRAENMRIIGKDGKRYSLKELYSVQKEEGPIYTCETKSVSTLEVGMEKLEELGISFYEEREEIPREIVSHSVSTCPVLSEGEEVEGYFVIPIISGIGKNGDSMCYTYKNLIRPTTDEYLPYGYFSIETGELVTLHDMTVANSDYKVKSVWNMVIQEITPWTEDLSIEKVKTYQKKYMEND